MMGTWDWYPLPQGCAADSSASTAWHAGDNDAADVAAALAAGKPIAMAKPRTIADGLQGRLGDLTWPPIRDHVSGAVTVLDEEIVAAMRLLFERMKVSTARAIRARLHRAEWHLHVICRSWWSLQPLRLWQLCFPRSLGIILNGSSFSALGWS